MAEPLYTDADVELVAESLNPGRNADRDYYRRRAVLVLDALTAGGWRPHAIESTIEQANQTRANTRAVVAEEIAKAIELAASMSYRTRGAAYRHAANIAREIGGRP
jgi:hypothetical protein